eukprot:6252-Heterococcus_DN1.PRE.1
MQGAVARVIHRYLSIEMYSQLHRAALRFGQASIRHSRQLSADQQFMCLDALQQLQLQGQKKNAGQNLNPKESRPYCRLQPPYLRHCSSP